MPRIIAHPHSNCSIQPIKDLCGPKCRGWFRDAHTGDLQRCDECGVFKDDTQAEKHVKQCPVCDQVDELDDMACAIERLDAERTGEDNTDVIAAWDLLRDIKRRLEKLAERTR